jgi:hypothetical protein
MPMPPLKELLTILVTTSPKRSNPSTALLERFFDTLHHGGHAFVYHCRKVILCDEVRQRHESTTQKYTNAKQAMRHELVTLEQNQNYEQFKANLRRLCDEATTVKIEQKNAKYNNNNLKDVPLSPFCNTPVHQIDCRQGYGIALCHALSEYVTTPNVIVIQHDRTMMRPTPIEETRHVIWHHINLKYVEYEHA